MDTIKYTSNKLTIAVLSVMLLFAVTVCAEEDDTPMFSLSGFGTLGIVHSTNDKADFTTNLFKPNGAGLTRKWSMDVDSLIGVQLTANLTPKLTAVVQAVAEQGHNNNYIPEFEWANIKYAFTPDFSIRLGRVVLPIFLVSDFRKVGYANPWVRPPLEVYSLGPITKNDGIDANYRFRIGEVTNTIQATYGQLTPTTPDGTEIKVRNQWNIVNITEYGSLTMRLGYYRNHTTVKGLIPLFNSFRQFGAEGIAIADRYSCDGSRVALTTFGLNYDPGNWFLMGELIRRETNCLIDQQTAGYISGGYRLGKFTPYLTYAQISSDSISDSGLSAGAFVPAAATLNTQLNRILGSRAEQKTISIGTRWDFMKNTSLKLQYDHTRLGSRSKGLFNIVRPGLQSGGSYNIFSATIDFVF